MRATWTLCCAFALAMVATCYSCQQVPFSVESQPTLRMARGNWDTGHFLAEIAAEVFREAGYDVEIVGDLAPEIFYTAVAAGEDIDLWVNGWFPVHDIYVQKPKVANSITIVGELIEGRSLEGYMIDRVTANRYGITHLTDLTDPDLAALFDTSGDGKADLIGCNAGWACEQIILDHLDRWDLDSTVKHVQGEYSLLMADVLSRARRGEPVLFYAWTPNWTAHVLKPGEDVVWINIPETGELPGLKSVAGCVTDPCSLGFGANRARAVVHHRFLARNPRLRSLLERMAVPLTDISAESRLLLAGEDSDSDIRRHALTWIETHRERVDLWLEPFVAGGEVGRSGEQG